MSHKHKNKKYNPNNKPVMENGHLLDTSPRVVHTDKLKEKLNIRPFPWTEKQKQLIELILDKETKMVFISGPAGVSKTMLAVYCGLRLLNEKKQGEIFYVRSAIESGSKSLGAVPGLYEEKLDLYLHPLKEKLNELLPQSEINGLMKEQKIKGEAINYMRGRQIESYLILDESQNLTYSEIVTLITRAGKYSKFVILGDPAQSDLHGKSGFKTMFNIFNDEESKLNGIHSFEFTKEDVMRSGVVKFILGKLEDHKSNLSKESMFA